MSNVSYISTSLFDTLAEVIAQHAVVYAQENPLHTIRQWLNQPAGCKRGSRHMPRECFYEPKITQNQFLYISI